MQGMPFSFFCQPNERKEIVIVDDAPTFSRFEHCMQDPRSKRWDIYVPCIDEVCNCPACAVQTDRTPYFAMYFTVIDLTPYENRDGEEVPFSKKILRVKPMQQKKIMRYFEREGTLRGMILEMNRGSNKDAAIGDPEFIEFMSEEDMATYVSYYVDKDNVEHEVICSEPYDYEAIMPDMTEDDLAQLVGMGDSRSTGSRHADDRAIGRAAPSRAAPGRAAGRPSARGREAEPAGDDWQGAPRRVASRRAAAVEQAEEVEYEEVAEAPPPRRGAPAARAPAAPAARTPARRAAPVIDPDDMPDAGAEDEGPPFEVDPPQRQARVAPARAAPARAAPAPAARQAPTRRAAPEPQAAEPRPGVAARRQQLRR